MTAPLELRVQPVRQALRGKPEQRVLRDLLAQLERRAQWVQQDLLVPRDRRVQLEMMEFAQQGPEVSLVQRDRRDLPVLMVLSEQQELQAQRVRQDPQVLAVLLAQQGQQALPVLREQQDLKDLLVQLVVLQLIASVHSQTTEELTLDALLGLETVITPNCNAFCLRQKVS